MTLKPLTFCFVTELWNHIGRYLSVQQYQTRPLYIPYDKEFGDFYSFFLKSSFLQSCQEFFNETFFPTRKHQPAKEISFIYVETVNSGGWREGKKRRKKIIRIDIAQKDNQNIQKHLLLKSSTKIQVLDFSSPQVVFQVNV